MTPEREQVLDQNYALPTQAAVDRDEEAKALLARCKEYVQRGCNERDYFAFALMSDIRKFLGE